MNIMKEKIKTIMCKQIIFEYKGLAYLIIFEEREWNKKDFTKMSVRCDMKLSLINFTWESDRS